MPTLFVATALVLAASAPAPTPSHARDGAIYDQGVRLVAPSPHAHADVAALAPLVGAWEVELTRHPGDSNEVVATGIARVDWLNRGHGVIERLWLEDFGGRPRSLVALVTHARQGEQWMLGEVDSWRMGARVYSGQAAGQPPEFGTAIRHGGSGPVTRYRVRLEIEDEFRFAWHTDRTTDGGASWDALERRRYMVLPADHPVPLSGGEGFGEPAPGRPAEAAQFDFLVGEWDAQHWMLFQGRELQWPAKATAVYALGGHAVLEHNWMDVDPNLPDAATTLVRIYNPLQRRWECLYTTNRFGSILYFGGRQIGDEVVLWPFDSDFSNGNLQSFVFHGIGEDSYSWYAASSTDRGDSWTKTWTIDFARTAGP